MLLAEELDDVLLRFGLRLRRLRLACKLTQNEVARHAGMTRSSIANIETGRQNVGLDSIYQIAEALGVHPVVLFDENAHLDLMYAREAERVAALKTVEDADGH